MTESNQTSSEVPSSLKLSGLGLRIWLPPSLQRSPPHRPWRILPHERHWTVSYLPLARSCQVSTGKVVVLAVVNGNDVTVAHIKTRRSAWVAQAL